MDQVLLALSKKENIGHLSKGMGALNKNVTKTVYEGYNASGQNGLAGRECANWHPC
jgi:hypothetical protein